MTRRPRRRPRPRQTASGRKTPRPERPTAANTDAGADSGNRRAESQGSPEGTRGGLQGIWLVVCVAVTLTLLVTFFAVPSEKRGPFANLVGLVKLGVMPKGLAAVGVGWLRMIFPLGIALGILIPGILTGLRLLELLKIRFVRWLDSLVFGFALGVGAVSLVTLGLGLAGLLQPYVVITVLALMALWGVAPARRLAKSAPGNRSATADGGLFGRWATGLIVAAAAAVLLLTWANCAVPAFDYDALEYHLGAPAQYVEAGRIRFLPGNVYSNFPLGVEMLYLDAIALCPDRIVAGQAAKAINFAFALATIGLVWCFGRRFFSERAGVLGAAFFALSPWVFQTTALEVYVTMGWSLYAGLAFFSATAAILGRKGTDDDKSAATGGGGEPPERVSRFQWVALAALATGLATGCKYPSAVLVAAPVAVAFVVCGIRDRRFLPWLKRVVLYGAIAIAVASPWFARNVAFTRNPVYPLAYNVFGADHWGARKEARWVQAHAPPGWGYAQLRRVLVKVHATECSSVLPYLFVPFALAGFRRKAAFALVALALGYFILWFLLTHQIERFFVPALPVLCAVSAWGLVQAARTRARIPVLCVAAAVGFFAFYTVSLKNIASGMRYPEGLLAGMRGPMWRARASVLAMPEGTKVLAVGEARSYYWGPRLATFTVFDESPLDALIRDGCSRREIAARLREAGYTHILVNWLEVTRLDRTYRFTRNGALHPGYSPYLSPEWFIGMVREGALEMEAVFGNRASREAFDDDVETFAAEGFFGELKAPLHSVELFGIL